VKLKSFNSIILFILISYFIMIIFSFPCVGAPVVEELYHNPFEPLPLSTVRFNAGIFNNSSDIEEVRLIVEECMNDLCYIDSNNISMNNTYTCCLAFFVADVDLTHENATQVKYHLEIKSNGVWYNYKPDYISINISNDQKADDNLKNETPGFECVSILLSFLCILFLKRHSLIIK